MQIKKKNALYAGSFNPMHEGHLSVLKKACKLFDKVYVLVAQNPEKEKNDIIKNINDVKSKIKDIKNAEVLEGCQEMLTANVAKELNIEFLIRSARNNSDYKYELDLASGNKIINNDLETILLIPDDQYLNHSSSLIKAMKGK
ncbi:pantetheine-phosphate adenylyltransferase [Mycoplasmopsis edwardii]|uniref:Pantetheine-phosphate adenylyltransferase n=1 Tax=Mycoplasmopsis edwardii TaxID=53558 RepID=A0ACD4PHY4_9BACT|nr:pantetheine-phosphate adenylyltransferase [Mycoplasmopsis edwardii]WBP84126.1 pantetheine-phosphate adenylyltransferase [Mycoplasmopsis edwardii]